MIKYALRCTNGHDFDSWFQSAQAFDGLAERGLVACAVCGSAEVSKALMAPKVRVGRDRVDPPAETTDAPAPSPLSQPASELEAKVAALRAKVEAEATYVGGRFVDEARAQHESGIDKPIWGEAKPQDAVKLIRDGIPVAPLPFLPKQKAN